MLLITDWQSLGPGKLVVQYSALSIIVDLTLAHFCKMVQVSMADRMGDRGEERERRLMASSQ